MRTVLSLLVVQLVLHWVVGLALAQTPPRTLDSQAVDLDYLRRDIQALQQEHLPARVATLEYQATETVWLTRGIGLAVIGQLVTIVWRRRGA